MAAVPDTIDSPQVSAKFALGTGETPVALVSVPGRSAEERGGLNEEHPVVVRNARPLTEDLRLDRHGFELRGYPTAVKNFYDEAEVREIYLPGDGAFDHRGNRGRQGDRIRPYDSQRR